MYALVVLASAFASRYSSYAHSFYPLGYHAASLNQTWHVGFSLLVEADAFFMVPNKRSTGMIVIVITTVIIIIIATIRNRNTTTESE